jgi:hypothetical protein
MNLKYKTIKYAKICKKKKGIVLFDLVEHESTLYPGPH